jgi:hypothetical protein
MTDFILVEPKELRELAARIRLLAGNNNPTTHIQWAAYLESILRTETLVKGERRGKTVLLQMDASLYKGDV